jgi:hypothetical protein
MAAKIKDWGDEHRVYVFLCPGCKTYHPFDLPRWTWNGSFDAPTFRPSLMVNASNPSSRCHSFVTDGKIQFLNDCWHGLAGQTVDLPDWEDA